MVAEHEHEDVVLVTSARRLGAVPVAGTTVLTSGRLRGRVGGGFSGYLSNLRSEVMTEASAISLDPVLGD